MLSWMAWLPSWLLAALLAQALGGTHKTIRGRRQTAIMTIFGLLSFQCFHPLLQILNSHDRLFESFAQVLVGFMRLFQLCIFVLYNCPQGAFLDRKSTRLNSSHQIISYA